MEVLEVLEHEIGFYKLGHFHDHFQEKPSLNIIVAIFKMMDIWKYGGFNLCNM